MQLTKVSAFGMAPALAIALVALAHLTTVVAAAKDMSLQYRVVVPDTKASAMMLGLANENTIFVIDKVENNKAKLNNGKPVWASLVTIGNWNETWQVRGVDSNTNPFCAAGATLGNGSWMVVGGNEAITYGGASSAFGKNAYQDHDGRKAIRIMEPNSNGADLSWIDQPNTPNRMTSPRWYPGIEGLPDGSVMLIGGATHGGYINRNTPNVDPAYATSFKSPQQGKWDQGGANPSFEFWPPDNKPGARLSKFMVTTSGLNMYPHTYLMPSGKIFMQANYSTILFEHIQNNEIPLPDMPNQIVRVYPASAATAMLPLTPQNKYTPTILFCGGTYMTDDQWGNYTAPNINMFEHVASKDCSSITPENADGSQVKNVKYVHEEDLPEPRTMGQFIHLPTGQMVIVNGASNGTAGYGNTTWNTLNINGQQVRLEGMAQEPTYRPVLYDPSKPKGQRLQYKNFGKSGIARLYHSSAILIPDGSIAVAGSNMHMDVVQNMPVDTGTKYRAFNTTYEMEQWYPDYYFKPRPQPKNLPSVIPYGGKPFHFTMDHQFMGKQANDLANRTKVMVIRPGFSTHAMNMGQRSLQLEHSYVVNDDGSVDYTVNPMPTNQNLFVAGPALLFFPINGVPSHGKLINVGADPSKLGNAPFNIKSGPEPDPLPAPKNNPKYNAKVTDASGGNGDGLSGGAIAGIVVAVVIGVLIIAALVLFLLLRYRRQQQGEKRYLAMTSAHPEYGPETGGYTDGPNGGGGGGVRTSHTGSFASRDAHAPFYAADESRMYGASSNASQQELIPERPSTDFRDEQKGEAPANASGADYLNLPLENENEGHNTYGHDAPSRAGATTRNTAYGTPLGFAGSTNVHTPGSQPGHMSAADSYFNRPSSISQSHSGGNGPYLLPEIQQQKSLGEETDSILGPHGGIAHVRGHTNTNHPSVAGPREMPRSNLEQHIRRAAEEGH